VLLNPGFPPSAGDLGTGLGIVGALPPVKLVAHHGLVQNGAINRDVKNGVVHLYGVHGVAPAVLYCKFHKIKNS
jgi:hypothetical protein